MRPRRPALAALVLGAVAALAPTGAGALPAADDPGIGRQWGLTRIGAPGAWAAGFTGEGTTIAVVDSGVSPDHPDLRDRLDGTAGLVDCVGPGGCVTGSGADDAGHGTHVAGIAAGTAGNGTGIAGVAPGARLLSIRALQQTCGSGGCDAVGTAADVAEAITWAADHGADVINLSLGSATQQILGPSFDAALEHAWDRGAIPVLAAGNTDLPIGTIFGVRAVLVAATTNADQVASYSGAIGNVDWALSAPGGEADDQSSCESALPNGILSTYFDGDPARAGVPRDQRNGYACVAGTSMAAPHVSGALAVLRSAGYDPEGAIDQLIATAVDLGRPGRDERFGSGLIDLARALGVSATGGPGVVAGQPTTTTSPTPLDPVEGTPAVAVPPPTTAPAVVPATTTTALVPQPVPTTAGGGDVAAGVPLDGPGDDDLPALPLTLAVVAVIATSSGHAWRYLAGASWARRTPPSS